MAKKEKLSDDELNADLEDEINYLSPSNLLGMSKINSVASLHQTVDYYIPIDANTISQHQLNDLKDSPD